jgi:hypothetical protein
MVLGSNSEMEVLMSEEKTARIRELNDAFRTTIAGGRVMVRAGVEALNDATKETETYIYV